MNEVLVFNRVYFSYDGVEQILRDVSFSIYEGEVVTIVGPNGGGKTTLLKLILGFIKPSLGNIWVYGVEPVSGRKNIGYLPQFSSVHRNIPMTAYEFVKLAVYPGIFSFYPVDIDERVSNVLRIVNAYDFRSKIISELSGGQFQRILFARAIVNDPKILILDEPTNFIDESSKKNFYEIIMSFKTKKTIIIVSHDLNMVSNFTDRVFCLNREMFIACRIDDLKHNLDLVYSNSFNYVEHKH
ncbi:MAG: metal ABC transporter ATP-binding protein [bacterium]|nr:metal ABC transporter ATP-binding protein [bacterium]